MVDKKLYNETWYYYLAGEWRTSFPNELKAKKLDDTCDSELSSRVKITSAL